MDYARFLRLRRPLWDEFEEALERAHRRGSRLPGSKLSHGEVEALALAYRRVLHDHALAASRFPGTTAAVRLERLALSGTRWLQRSGGDDGGGAVAGGPSPGRSLPGRFLFDRFPRAFRHHLPLLGVVLALFLASGLLGLVLAIARPGLGTALLGPESLQGLREGRLWTESLVTTVPPAVASSGIATNNLGVALTSWAGGAAAGLIGFYVVVLNGVLLGAVFGITGHYSMAGDLGVFVAAHGPLEIFLILVCGAAGLGVGRALVEAGDRPRGQRLREATSRSLTLLLGALPWFVVLGAVEAWVSPAPEVPTLFKGALGLSLLGVFLVLGLQPVADGGNRRAAAGDGAGRGADSRGEGAP